MIPVSLYELAARSIPSGSHILNFGCGSVFSFETITYAKRCINFSCDVVRPAYIPPVVDTFFVASVETPVGIDKAFDVVTFFEVVEHIDKTEELMKNCFRVLKPNGLLIFSFPNLASLYGRVELLLGFQPHILEISNERSDFGTGIFGKWNGNGNGSIHHIRGITYRAMMECVRHHGFDIVKAYGYEYRIPWLFRYFPGVAPIDLIV